MKTLFAISFFRTRPISFLAQGLAISLVLLAMFSAQAQPGLVAQYAFNGTFFDQTTNGNHAVATGNPSFVADRNGQVNGAIGFGGCGNPQFLRVPNSPSLQGSNAMTVSFWARVDLSSGMEPGDGTCTANGRQVFFAKAGDGYGVSPPGFLGLTYPADGQQKVTFEANAGQVNAVATKEQPGNTWHHYAYVLTNSEVKLYIDAQLVLTTSANLSFTEANQQDLYLGVMGPKSSPILGISYWYPLKGALDDVRIFNRNLSLEEVRTVFTSDDAGNCAPAAATILPAGNALFCDGQPLTLKATSIPPAVQLQWQRDGQPIAQATLDSLTVSQSGAYRIETTKRQDAWKSDIGGFKTTMNDVQFVNSNVGYVVGTYGLVLKTTDGGATFDTLTTGRQETLTTVSFVNEQVGYVGGISGLVLKTINGGASWFALNFPASGIVREVQFLSETIGYVLASQPGYDTDGLLYKTINGGSDWVQVGLPNADKLIDISFVDADFGWIASLKDIHTTSDGGASWTQKNFTSCNDPYINRFAKIYALGRNNFWILGGCDRKTLTRTTDGGATWTEHYIPPPYATSPASSSLYPNDIIFYDSQNGYIVAEFSSKIEGSNTWGGSVIFKTQNGGQTWTDIYDNILRADPYAISFINASQALAVGNGGLMLDVSGTVSLRNPQNRSFLPLKTVGGNASRVFAAGGTIRFVLSGGSFFGSDPRTVSLQSTLGQDWVKTESTINPSYSQVIGGDPFDQIKFKSEQFGWRVRYRDISVTKDGGVTWQGLAKYGPGLFQFVIEKAYLQTDSTGWALAAYPSNYPHQLGLISFSGSSATPLGAPYNTGLLDLQFIDDHTGFITTSNGKLIKTTDGGNSWSVQLVKANTALTRVFFVTAQMGWVIGKNGLVLKTTDGGSNWTEQTTGTTNDLNGICFLSAQEGYVVGGNGTLLKTANGGITWVNIETNTNNALNDIIFVTRDKGYAVGESGTILSFNPTLLPDCKTISAAVNVSQNIGAVCESAGSGPWNDAATWSCGHVPLSCDQVVVGHVVTLRQSVQVRGVEIRQNGQLAVQGGNVRLEN